MGWKKVKGHYRIGHIVQVTEKGICIGSGYIHDIIVVGLDGHIVKGDEHSMRNDELARYQSEMMLDPQKLRELVTAEDEFAVSLPVYTYDGAAIVEKRCEEYGWPNVTHDGAIMYENTFSPDRDRVVEWAKSNCLAAIRNAREWLDRCQAEVKTADERLAGYLANAAALGVEVDPT